MNLLDRPLTPNSFRRGFMRGFLGASNIVSSLKINRSSRFDGSVAKAWLDVGRVLRNSLHVEGEGLNEKANSKTKQ